MTVYNAINDPNIKLSVGSSGFGTQVGNSLAQKRADQIDSPSQYKERTYASLQEAAERASAQVIIGNAEVGGGYRDQLPAHYKRSMLDSTVVTAIETLYDLVTYRGFRFQKIRGRRASNMTQRLEKNLSMSWVKGVIKNVFDTEFYGASLVEFIFNTETADGEILQISEKDRARLNVIRRRFYKDLAFDITDNFVQYDSQDNEFKYLEILRNNNPNDLGLLHNVSIQVITKNSELVNWGINNRQNTSVIRVFTGNELFQRGNTKDEQRALSDLQTLASTQAIMLNHDEKLELLSPPTSFNYQTFQEYVEYVDRQINALILHIRRNTMVAQGVQESLADKDLSNVRARLLQIKIEDYTNEVILPKLSRYPFYSALSEYEFKFNALPLDFQQPARASGGSSTGNTSTAGQGSGSAS